MNKFVASWMRRAAFVVASLAALPITANATSCPGDSACNGNSYTATYTQIDLDTWTIQIDVNVLSSYTGTLGSDKLTALAIKPAGTNITNGSLVSSPGDLFSYFDTGLNNGGGGGCGGGDAGFLCAGAGAGAGATVEQDDVLSFVFQLDAESLGTITHLKYLYIDASGKKVGSLGSFDIPLLSRCTNGDCEPCTDGNCGDVPTPASAALLGIGLVAFSLVRSRRRAS